MEHPEHADHSAHRAQPPLISTRAGDPELSWATWNQLAPTTLAARLRTGCVYEEQPPDTFGLLVTRDDPRTRGRTRRRGARHARYQPVRAPIHAHWPLFAPSVRLLTGHETACAAGHCRGVGRCTGHAALHLGWPAFAAAYRAELEAWPFSTRLAVAQQVAAWLRTAPTVTIVSGESKIPAGSTADCWAQRHVFRDWVRSLLPLAVPLSAQTLPTAPARVPTILRRW